MAQAFDPIEQAMIETNREIAAEAWDQESTPLDTDNDRTPETTGEGLEGQHVEDDEAAEVGEGGEAETVEAAEGEGETVAAAKPEDGKPAPKVEAEEKPNGRVPPARLREQTERTRAAEAERDTLKAQLETEKSERRRELDALNAKFDGVLAAIRQQQQPQKTNGEAAAEEVIPDIFEDPKGYDARLQKTVDTKLSGIDQKLQVMRVDLSMQMAHDIYKGDFEKAVEWAKQTSADNPEQRAVAERIWKSSNPGKELVLAYKRAEALRTVGDDPAAYETRIKDETRKALMADPEFRKTLIAELRGEAATGANGKPNTITRLPPSLASAAGSSRAGETADAFDGSDQAIANSAWR